MNKQEVTSTLNRIGIKPNRLMGQNFLVDDEVLSQIVQISGVGKGSTVVEIGPGLGVLTGALLETGAKVVAIEQERRFVAYLHQKFYGTPLSVIAGNAVLKIPELQMPDGYQVVSNLPYSITSPVINLFLARVSPRPSSLTLMVQREVAERLTAPVGSAERGMLTVLIELMGSALIIQNVPPSAFWPSPKVDSAVIRIVVKRQTTDVEQIMKVVKAGFAKRRAQIRNALKLGLKLDAYDTNRILASSNIDPSLRAEALTVEDWQNLAKSIAIEKK